MLSDDDTHLEDDSSLSLVNIQNTFVQSPAWQIQSKSETNLKPKMPIGQWCLSTFLPLIYNSSYFPLIGQHLQMSEDESRAWQRGANSEASQRPFGASGKRPPSPTGGRGRGRGRGSAPYYDRSALARILASDWSRQITWPEYWSLIGQWPKWS